MSMLMSNDEEAFRIAQGLSSVGTTMTDEEVLKIAQGLTRVEWDAFAYAVDVNSVCVGYRPTVYPGLVRKRVMQYKYDTIIVTPLGYRVWEWGALFM